MSRSAEEAALEYRQALDDLKDNNKMQINLMTILADDYNQYSQEIIRVIAQQIEKVVPAQKLAVMYVMDSILKNVTGSGNYKDHIEKVIHRLFVHVFETGDERTRLALHRLRQTWAGIFQRSTLYKIDLAVHAIDPAWPIVTPQPTVQRNVVANAPTTSTAASAAVPVAQAQQPQPQNRAAKVHVNPHFFQKSSSVGAADKRQVNTPVAEKRGVAADPRLVRTTENGRSNLEPRNAVLTAPQKPVANGRKVVVNPAFIKQEPVDTRGDVDERVPHTAAPAADENIGARHFNRRREVGSDVGNRSPSDTGMKRKAEVPVDDEVSEKKSRGLLKTPSPQPTTTASLARPTNDLGSHAFVSAPFCPAVPVTVVPQMVPTVAPVVVSGSQIVAPAILPAIPSIPSTSAPYVTTDGVTAVPVLPIPGIPGMPPIIAPRLPIPPIMPRAPLLAPPVPVAPPVTHVITNDTPKLEGIPANNRIFVDGRAYEVSYIDDIPVIERNGLPHRIYFTGAPRNVIIDGVAHLMSFGEEKRVMIDGEEHVLRFGAPSRELYMGTYPFKGAFGGPPIFATINGVRHEIRLGGPPPEVKIEPDPCYELLRHMPRGGLSSSSKPAAQNATSSQQSGNGEQPSLDVKGLLAKLQKSGFLSFNNASNASNAQKEESGKNSPPRAVTPPIPSEHRGEVTERLPKPPTDLKNFSMRALKIRYDSVVESLHQKRHVCPNCGLRFTELKGERYQQHLDWHFRENLRTSEAPRCRKWYLSSDEWMEFSEQEELTAATSSSRSIETSNKADDGKDSNSQNVPCNAVNSRECGVCKEKFEEYWDEDDDAWKLKDCMLNTDGRAFHPGCILDASTLNRSISSDFSEEESSDKPVLVSADASVKRKLLLAP